MVVEPPPPQAENFGFRYESKGCPFEIIDAFNDTYRQYGMAVPMPMRLTDSERAAIYEAVSTTGFFDLPRWMNRPDTSDLNGGTYELEVRNGVANHTALWRNTWEWTLTDEGERLMKLHMTILKIVRARADVVQVQPKGCGCGGRH